MKQKQFAPMSVAEMGTVLFAANEGYLEDVPVEKVLDFEAGLLSFMKAEYAGFVQSTNQTGAYNDDVVSNPEKNHRKVQNHPSLLVWCEWKVNRSIRQFERIVNGCR